MIRKYKIKVSGKVYEVEVESADSQDSSSTGATTSPKVRVSPPVETPQVLQTQIPPVQTSTNTSAELIAPIPGKIFKVHVKPGDAVKSGDLLMIIEAMKMENEVMAEFDGKISSVPVKEGDSVAAGDVLVRFE